MTVATHLTLIGSDFPPVRAQLLPRRAFAPILAILADIGSCFAAVLSNLTPITTNLPPVRAYFFSISPQLAAIPRPKPAAV
jgi:hypothetical protein